VRDNQKKECAYEMRLIWIFGRTKWKEREQKRNALLHIRNLKEGTVGMRAEIRVGEGEDEGRE
jgi:hypothetical protein